MTMLITGGRGRIAAAVHSTLVDAGQNVRLASRNPSSVPGSIGFDPADPATLEPALRDITQVLLYADHTGADAVTAAAEQAGVKQVVLISSMAAMSGPDGGDPHALAELAIRQGPYATTVLQPGAFMSNALRWVKQLRATGQVRLPYLEAEEAPIHERDIADAAARILLDGPGNGHDGRAYVLTGPESLTRRRQLELIAEITGNQVEAVDLTPEQAHAEMDHFMSPSQLDALLGYWASQVGNPQPISPAIELLTGHSGRTFRDWLADHRQSFA